MFDKVNMKRKWKISATQISIERRKDCFATKLKVTVLKAKPLLGFKKKYVQENITKNPVFLIFLRLLT